MDLWQWLLAILIPLGIALYCYIHHRYTYWSSRGLLGPPPSLLSFGTATQIVGSTNPAQTEVEMVHKYGPIYGTYVGLVPTLTITDLSLIKQIMLKDFHLFVNRRQLPAYHDMANNNLFFVEDANWKRMRSIASPSFSSAKLRAMYPLTARCIGKLTTFLDRCIEHRAGVINAKDTITGYMLDVSSTTMFATETNANEVDADMNPVLHAALTVDQASLFQVLSYLTMPKWFNNLVRCQHLFNYESVDFFQQLVQTIIQQRRSCGTSRNDLIQLLMDAVDESDLTVGGFDGLETSLEEEEVVDEVKSSELKKGPKNRLTEIEIISNAILFFGAGFDTTTSGISSCLFELTTNPEIQERLYTELEKVLSGVDPASDQYYELVMSGIPYLDAVIKETLRKYTPLLRLERRCSIDGYNLGGVILNRGQLVEVPVYAIHYNEDFYPEPHRFNPERFLPENKQDLVPYAFLGFGIGNRNCIGMRAAYQNFKFLLAKLVREYRLMATSETPKELEVIPFKFAVVYRGFKVKVVKR